MADDGKSVKISVDQVQKLGVRTEPAALRVLARTRARRGHGSRSTSAASSPSRPSSRAGSKGCT